MENGLHWYNNGKEQRQAAECPDGFVPGRLPVSDETRKKHSQNNAWKKMTEEQKIARAKKISQTKRARTQAEIDAEIAKAKRTSLTHYGTDFPMRSIEIKDKLKQTFVDKYGVDNPAKVAEVKSKIEQTNLNKYGAKNPFAATQIKKKIKQTNLERYGCENYQQTEEARSQARKYYKLNKDIILEIIRQACLEKYGVDNYTKTADYKKWFQENWSRIDANMKATCQKLYGVDYYLQSNEIQHTRRKAYKTDEASFDSLPELALYLYALFHNEDIVRNPVRFEYEFDGKTHYYFPDFRYKGQLIELKGNHFFYGNRMINPFDRSQDALYEAKHQCALRNNVQILVKKDYQKYVDWFNDQGYKKEDFIN